MYQVTCAHCKETFEAEWPDQLYCTKKCGRRVAYEKYRGTPKHLALLARRAESRKPCTIDGCDALELARGLCNHHYDKDRTHSDPRWMPQVRACDNCENEYQPSILGTRYCTRICLEQFKEHRRSKSLKYHAVMAQREEEKALAKATRPPGPQCTVDECDEPVETSEMCKAHYRRAKLYGDPNGKPPPRVCKQCSASYEPRGLAQQYCTRGCMLAAKYERDRLTDQVRRYGPDDTCSECDCDLPPHARGRCRNHYKRWARVSGMKQPPSDAWAGQRKHRTQRRHAVTRRGATNAETFSREEIFERDQYICGICTEQVDPLLPYPHPMSASLDHVVAIARGGAHTRTNTQCSHLLCNQRKGDKAHPGVTQAAS